MQIKIRADSIEIEGYVNAVERNSKPLNSRAGKFIERICKGAFKKALKRNDDVKLLLNHEREIGSTKKGNLELTEDSIGLRAKAVVTDPEVVQKGRNGELVGWSFGYYDRPEAVERSVENGMPYKIVKDLDLKEVSILDRTRTPAYEGTLLIARAEEEEVMNISEAFLDDAVINEEHEEEHAEERSEEQLEQPETADEQIDYSFYEQMIKEMRGGKNE